jgi:hypothetical protein
MLSRPNPAFEQADADLHAETSAASGGLHNLTNSRASLRLSSARETEAGVWYELWLLFGPADQVNGGPGEAPDWTKQYLLGTFFVPWTGYPIRTGHSVEMANRPAIAAYFVAMAKDPTSPLVNYLTFNLRRQEQTTAGA